MNISEEELRKFQKLYKKEFNEEISVSEATEKATKLLNLLMIVALAKKSKK